MLKQPAKESKIGSKCSNHKIIFLLLSIKQFLNKKAFKRELTINCGKITRPNLIASKNKNNYRSNNPVLVMSSIKNIKQGF